MPTLASSFYSPTETNENIEPYREYRGEVVQANASYDFAIGGDIVSAVEYAQGSQGETLDYMASEDYVAEQLPQRVYEPTQPRTIDDMLDPYGSPMLEGFLQSDFEPPAVVGYITEDGKEYQTKPGKPKKD